MNSSYGYYLSFLEKTYIPELEMSKKDLLPSVDLSYSLSDTDKFSSSVNRISGSWSMPIGTMVGWRISKICGNTIFQDLI